MTDDERASHEADSPLSDGPLSDGPLLDLLDALVESRGRVAAAEALGVNYRTMMACYESRRVSRRMRRALQEFRDAGGAEVEAGGGDDAGTDSQVEALGKRTLELEEENQALQELVETQANQIDDLERQVAALEQGQQPMGDAEQVDSGEGQEPRQLRQGKPVPQGAGVVTLEKQPGDDDALGPAGALVNEWRELRNPAAPPGSRVKRAEAAIRRWELEVELLRDFHLTLPPETEPLDDSRRADHIRWRREALAEARWELARAKRIRVLTLGLWRR